MSEAARLGKLARNLCHELNLEPDLVRSILVEPRSVTATVHELNDNERKFVNSDGDVALRTITRPLEFPR
jgi:hypothetical protein